MGAPDIEISGTAHHPKDFVPNSTPPTISGCSLERAGSSARLESFGLDVARWWSDEIVVYLTNDVRFDGYHRMATN